MESLTSVEKKISPEIVRSLRIGLVLAGGGGKGAYQVGVYRFIAEFLELLSFDRFECISGTSVGALNAILFATATPKQALDTWKSMANFIETAGLTKKIVAVAKPLLFYSIVPLISLMLAILFWKVGHGLSTVVAACLLYAFFTYGIAAVLGDLGLVFFFGDINWFVKLDTKRVETIVECVVASIGMSYFVLIVTFWPFSGEPYFKDNWVGFPKVVVNVFMWISLIVISGLAWWPLEKRRQSAIKMITNGVCDQSKLRDILRERLAIAQTLWRSSKLFVTVSRKGVYFDPERSGMHFDSGPLPPPPDGTWVSDEWLPEYVDLRKTEPDDSLEQLLMSAAIPVVFPNRRDRSGVSCDGGYVDNEPILPHLLYAQSEIIVLVSLDHEYDASPKRLHSKLRELWLKTETLAHQGRFEDVLDVETRWAIASDVRDILSSEEVQSRNPIRRLEKVKLIHLTPSRALKGLLDFSLASIVKLEQLGYADAAAQFPNQFKQSVAALRDLPK